MVQIPPALLVIMERKKLIIGFVVFVVVVFFGYLVFANVFDGADVLENDVFDDVVVGSGVVDFEDYNYDYVDEEVKGVLSAMVAGKRTAFYLPVVGYINVSRGSSFGVAFALNNPEPSGENSFEYEWTVDDSVVGSCGVGVDEAQGWIERGWESWGKIPEGWVDHITVYFRFPVDAPLCSVKYNFEIRKDGVFYDSKVVEFNLV